MKHQLNLSETIFIAILATAMGIAWWAYSLIYAILDPGLKAIGLSGIIDGLWHIGGIFFGFILRKPGSAILGETLAACVESMISQWGFSAIISGVCQGLAVELWFLAMDYQRLTKLKCAIGGALSAVGGYAVTLVWSGYYNYSLKFNLIYLGWSMLSAAILGGLGARLLALRLAKAGVLNQFKIAYSPHG